MTMLKWFLLAVVLTVAACTETTAPRDATATTDGEPLHDSQVADGVRDVPLDGPLDPCALSGKLSIVSAQHAGQAEAGHEIQKAFDGKGFGDGDPDSRWALKVLPTDVTFDLGAQGLLCAARFSFFRFDEGRIYRFSVALSQDGSGWSQAVPLTNSTAAEWTEVALGGQQARYVRLHIESAEPASTWAGLWEVELRGTMLGQPAQDGAPDAPTPDAGVDASVSPDLPGAKVILQVDFDQHPAGDYTSAQIAADWGKVQWSNTGTPNRAKLVQGTDAYSGTSLRIYYPQGGVGPGEGGSQWLVDLPASYDEVQVSYRVKFIAGVDFRLGGKLPGLCGGKCYTGGNNGLDGWSARMMWRTGGDVVQYVYWPGNSGWGDDIQWDYGGQQRTFTPGKWHQVRTRIVVNTVGQSDGVLQCWFDGALAVDRNNMKWRDPSAPAVAIEHFYFSTFYGGNTSDWAPDHDAYVFFDDFVFTAP